MSEQRVDLEQEIPLDVQDCDTARAKELFGGRPTALIPTREGLDMFALKITAENFCRERQLTAVKAEKAKQAEQIKEARELLEQAQVNLSDYVMRTGEDGAAATFETIEEWLTRNPLPATGAETKEDGNG